MSSHTEAHLPDHQPTDQTGWLLPQSVANAAKQRRQQVVLNGLEAERLDRIRNPSKYLGK